MSTFPQSKVQVKLLSVAGIDDVTLDRYALSLSAEELARAYHLKTEELRTEFIASHGALREILSEYVGEDPASIIFASNRHTKPKVIYPAGTGIEFNFAHSAGKIAYAFSIGHRVGMDIEAVSPTKFDPALPATIFSDGELREWESLPDELKLRGFFCGWTRKEAFIKAVGKGLSLDLKSFSVTIDPTKPVTLNPPHEFAHEQWSLYGLDVCSGFEAAVVVEGNDCEIVAANEDSREASSKRQS